MSATPGKILVDGIATVSGQDVFVLKMIQGRDPEWANRVFFARFDAQAAWLDQLQPPFDRPEFFFERSRRVMAAYGAHTARQNRPARESIRES
jgi:hypothetical protein